MAIGRTFAGGNVHVLTPGDYDANIFVEKSITIIDTTGHAALYPAAGAIFVEGSGIEVVIKGFEIRGMALTTWGVDFKAGASLTLEGTQFFNVVGQAVNSRAPGGTLTLKDVSIHNRDSFASDMRGVYIDSTGGPQKVVVINALIDRTHRGIVVNGTNNVQLSVSDTTISNVTRNGIDIGVSGGTTKLTIKDSQIVSNGGNGVMIAPTGSAKVNTVVMSSALDGNVIGLRSFPANPATSTVSISDTSASNNAGGIHASGKSNVGIIHGNISSNSAYGVTAVSPAAIRIGSSMVNGNTLGFSGPISSYGNNQLLGNTTQGSKTPVAPGSIP